MKKWSIPVTEKLDEGVERLIKNGIYMTKADLVRDAVRKLLEEFVDKGVPLHE